MKFGVVVFPGSNCDHDAWFAVSNNLGQKAEFIWHDATSLGDVDAIILPGGFAYGDYLRCGAIAKFSPVMQSVRKFAADGGLVLGICNGFQILAESGLLPGVLLKNRGLRFACKPVPLRVETTNSPFTSDAAKSQRLVLPIAHGEGCYVADERTLDQLEAEDRVVLRYLDNPNGSMRDIAGILSEKRNVMGLMPHPERATEPLMGSTDGLVILQSMVSAVAQASVLCGSLRMTPQVVQAHQLTAAEFEKIVALLGREPTYTELGIFSVMWSEHCSYKSSRIHLKKLPTLGKLVLQGPGENAGIIDIGDGYAIAFKIESHNHPSFIEPFQGAATGVGGILRDIFTMGARPIAVMDALRFGPLDIPRNRRILQGVISGIAHYGNCFGVPTVGGECVFEECYNGNPLVNVFALGVFKKDEVFYGKAKGVGNPVIYVGAKTGRDGIHGASMASAEFTEESKQKRPNVQVGDPFLEKLLLEACLEAMQTGAIVGIQDMGAAGLTCSTCEMGSRAETGIEIDLQYVPQRETGMTPYEIMLSESQERMLLVAEKGREEEVFRVFRKWGLDAVTVGRVTADGILRVKDHGQVVAEISNRALADEAPVYDRPHTKPYRAAPLQPPGELPAGDVKADLIALLESGDICSKRWIWEQYDYSVRTNTIEGPGADAAIVRIKETGTSIAMSLDGNARYCVLDPREGTMLIVAECCRNLSTAGAFPVAATNNLNFGNPERPEIMAQIVASIEGMAEACEFFETPITGGNVSLYNETLGEAIYPTPVMGVVGLMKTAKPTPIHFQEPDRAVILLGGFGECDNLRFGGTQYAKVILNALWGLPPALDMDYEKRVHQAIREIVAGGLVESAHDLSDGGLAVALAEASFGAARVGAHIQAPTAKREEIQLFHEGPSRIVLSTSKAENVLSIARQFSVEAVEIGVTMKERLRIDCGSETLLDCDLTELMRPWETSLERTLHQT